jgi:hypothetical protein
MRRVRSYAVLPGSAVEGWRPTSGQLTLLDPATFDDRGLSDPEAHVDRAVLICIEGSGDDHQTGQHRLAK